MKRDWDLLRWILNQAESCEGAYPIIVSNGAPYSSQHYQLDLDKHDFGAVYEHVLLLGDAGLAKVRDLGRTYDGPAGVAIDRLTMAGHDVLDATRDEKRWQKAMTTVNEKGGAVTIGVLVQILSALME